MKKIITILCIGVLLATPGRSSAQTWSSIGTSGMNGSIKCLLTDATNNVMYAGGAFTTADGQTMNSIAKWNGSSWTAVGAGFNSTVWSLCIYNNELYAGGAFTMSGSTPVSGIAKFNGSAWVAVGTGAASSGIVAAMCVFNNELYAGGFFSGMGGVATTKNLAKWNGTSWASIGGGAQDGVMSFVVHNNELYMGGYFVVNNISFSQQYRIAKLSGTSWVNVGSKGVGDANAYWGVRAMSVYNGNVHASGYFAILDDGTTQARHTAKWNGSSWSTLGSGANAGITATTSTYVVNTSAVYNNSLYEAGNFTGAGGTTADNIASWNGTSWSAAGSGVNGQVNAMAVYGGNLIVAGDFSTAGGNNVGKIAKWNTTTGIADLNVAKASSVNYPNPFNSSTTIVVSSEVQLSNAQLSVCDILGKEAAVMTNISDNTIHFNRNDLRPGIYFYTVKENGGSVATGKFIIE